MESNSYGSRILCSASSFQILKRQAPEMPCKKRGKIPVKGKGDMTVYWIGDQLIAKNKKARRKHAMSPRDTKDTSLLEDYSMKDIMRDDSVGPGLENSSAPDLNTLQIEAENEKREYPEDSKTAGSSQTDDESSEAGFEDEPQTKEQTGRDMACYDLGEVFVVDTQGRAVDV